MFEPAEVDALNQKLKAMEPGQILAELSALVPRLTVAFSGAEDVLLIHLASKLRQQPAYFSIDTGRLHPITLSYIERVREHYQLPLEVLHPDQLKLNELIKNKGLFSFYKDGHEECCGIRKVAPLRQYLQSFDAWVTGQRKDQSPTRGEIPVVEIDPGFSSSQHQVLKVNPLANWSSEQTWQHIRALEIPYNPLHDKGYVSIGCDPCTKPVGPGQHEREGRWWWEEATIKECGLHKGNLEDKQ